MSLWSHTAVQQRLLLETIKRLIQKRAARPSYLLHVCPLLGPRFEIKHWLISRSRDGHGWGGVTPGERGGREGVPGQAGSSVACFWSSTSLHQLLLASFSGSCVWTVRHKRAHVIVSCPDHTKSEWSGNIAISNLFCC